MFDRMVKIRPQSMKGGSRGVVVRGPLRGSRRTSFHGVRQRLSHETIGRFVDESLAESGRRPDHGSSAHPDRALHPGAASGRRACGRQTRERRPGGLLFVCVHNAGRSQIAPLRSSTTMPRGASSVRSSREHARLGVNPAVAEVMAELGLDLSKEFPKPLSGQSHPGSSRRGHLDRLRRRGPIYPGKHFLTRPSVRAGRPLAEIRPIRMDRPSVPSPSRRAGPGGLVSLARGLRRLSGPGLFIDNYRIRPALLVSEFVDGRRAE